MDCHHDDGCSAMRHAVTPAETANGNIITKVQFLYSGRQYKVQDMYTNLIFFKCR